MFQTLSFLFSSSNRFFHEMKSFELFGSSRQWLPANGFWLLVVILAAPQFFPLFILFDYICRANRSEFLSYRYFQSLNNNFETKWNEKTSNKSNFRFECGVSAYFTLFTIYCVCFISLQMNNFFSVVRCRRIFSTSRSEWKRNARCIVWSCARFLDALWPKR